MKYVRRNSRFIPKQETAKVLVVSIIGHENSRIIVFKMFEWVRARGSDFAWCSQKLHRIRPFRRVLRSSEDRKEHRRKINCQDSRSSVDLLHEPSQDELSAAMEKISRRLLDKMSANSQAI